jgi:hypothetical protein
MNGLRKHSVYAFGVLAFLALLLVANSMISRPAQAQNPNAGSAPVRIVSPLPLPIAGSTSIAGAVQVVNGSSSPLLVRNMDEPALNPYQEKKFSLCAGEFCNLPDYSVVPAGKRLVITDVSGYVDVQGGTLPNSYLQSSYGGDQYAVVFFPLVKGTTSASGTRMVVNQHTMAFFGPGEVPHMFFGLTGTSDSFSGGAQLMLTGYYVNIQ